jgi:hypothetical protein
LRARELPEPNRQALMDALQESSKVEHT